MRRKLLGLAGFIAAAMFILPASSQTGHPAKGSWIGYWGPNEDERNRMLLVLDWQNQELVGTINPGRNSVEVARLEIDYDSWTLTLEADMPSADGAIARYVATGKLENLGSWNNRRYSGTYRHGNETGGFRLVRN